MAKVAKIGTAMMFFVTPDDQVGYVKTAVGVTAMWSQKMRQAKSRYMHFLTHFKNRSEQGISPCLMH